MKYNRNTPWFLALQGLLLLIAGGIILFQPGITLAIITRLVGIILLFAGIILAFSSTYRRETTKTFMLLEGVIDIGLGIVFTFFPEQLAGVFIIILGIIAFLSGLINLWMLIRMRTRIKNAGFIRNGVVMIFGIFLLINPIGGKEVLGVIIGVFAIMLAAMSFYHAYKLFFKKKTSNID